MRKLTLIAAIALLVCGAGVLAVQSSLPKLGLTQKDVETWATGLVDPKTGAMDRHNPPLVPAAMGKVIQAMGPEARTALVREVLAIIKATLMAPALHAAQAARIKETSKAIDHGVDAQTYGMNTDVMAAIRMMSVMSIVETLRRQPAATLVPIFENDRVELAQRIKETTGADRAKAQKDLAALNALVPLAKSNPEDFKKAYILARSAAAGGPDTEAGLKAATATDAEKAKIREEQRLWNAYNLKARIKSHLGYFVEQAGKARFASPARLDGDHFVFVDPLLVVISDVEAMCLRMGQAPTAAAVAFARAWIKEL